MSVELRLSLDTNILIYAIDGDAGDRHPRAQEIIRVRLFLGRQIMLKMRAANVLARIDLGHLALVCPGFEGCGNRLRFPKRLWKTVCAFQGGCGRAAGRVARPAEGRPRFPRAFHSCRPARQFP
jgi:hypothetical protein